MKPFVALIFSLAALIFAGCSTTGATSATMKGLPAARPAIAEDPDGRALRVVRLAAKGGAFAILQNNPSHVDDVVAFGAAWDVFAGKREITEEEIAAFVADFACERGLKYAALLVLYTDLAREVLTLMREQLGGRTLNLNDPRAQRFVATAREGIRGAIVLVRAFNPGVVERA